MDFTSMMNQPHSNSRDAANQAFREALDQLQEIWYQAEVSRADSLAKAEADRQNHWFDPQALEEAGEDLEQFFNERQE